MLDVSQQSVAYLQPVMITAAIVCALLAAGLLIWYLLRRPPLDWRTKILLLCGLGVLPIGTAMMGNAATFKHTQERAFCGSCHVMGPYLEDSSDPTSLSLAARHGRNEYFGKQNCYACHQDYGMYGTVMTKVGGMRHVWEYYTEYHAYTLDQAREKIHLRDPFTNANCTGCHSMNNPGWRGQPDHAQLLDELLDAKVSCLGAGCHGPSHPFSKDPVPPPSAEDAGGAR